MLWPSSPPEDEGDHEQDNEDPEQHLGNASHRSRQTSKAKYRCHQRNNKKHDGIIEHELLLTVVLGGIPSSGLIVADSTFMPPQHQPFLSVFVKLAERKRVCYSAIAKPGCATVAQGILIPYTCPSWRKRVQTLWSLRALNQSTEKASTYQVVVKLSAAALSVVLPC